MKKNIIIILLMLFFVGTGSDLFAQRGQRQQGREGQMRDGGRMGQNPENRPGMQQRQAMKDLKRLERLRILKLLDLLNLDAETEAMVIPHIRNHHKQMFKIMKKHQQKIDQLAKGLRKNNFSDEEIIELIIEIDKLEMERQEKIRIFHIRAKEILTAEQLGKLYVFQARFGGEVLEKMRNFRKAQEDRRQHQGGN